MSSQVMEIGSITLSPEYSRRPIIAKRSVSAMKIWYAIFFSGEGVAIKVSMGKGKNITGKYYKDVVLEKSKNFRNDALSLVLNIPVFYYDNVPTHTFEIVTALLKKEKVTVLPHLSYSLDLAPCNFFMFPKLK